MLLSYAGEQVGLWDISMQCRDFTNLVQPDPTEFNYYIISADNADFYGYTSIISPLFGSIVANDLLIELEYHHMGDSELNGNLQMEFNVIGIIDAVYPGEMNRLASTDIEPASWFYTVTPVSTLSDEVAAQDAPPQKEYGLPSRGYIEFVLHEEEIKKNRLFVDHEQSSQSPYEVEVAIRTHQASEHSVPHTSTAKQSAVDATGATNQAADDKVNVCIWSSNVMDGQKRIWLQQIEHLDPLRFRFTWMLTLSEGRTLAEEAALSDDKSLYSAAVKWFSKNRNGRVIDSPFNGIALGVEALSADPGDGRQPVSETWNGNEIELYRYSLNLYCVLCVYYFCAMCVVQICPREFGAG